MTSTAILQPSTSESYRTVPVSFDGPLFPNNGHVVPVANAAAIQNVIDFTRAYAHVTPCL